ncbi:MAG: hypothetical protein ABWY93_02935 [Mycobacterium sp.]
MADPVPGAKHHHLDNERSREMLLTLGTPKAIRIIFALMILYALVIGGLVVGYSKVQACLADYTNQSAQSTAVRTQAAAEDRALNAREAAVDQSDRVRIRASNDATLVFIQNVAETRGQPTPAALAEFRKVNATSAVIFDQNENERVKITTERRNIEARRAASPPPAPPSETC